MGRGDFRTKRGKIRRGSNGNSRPNASKLRAEKRAAAKAAVKAA
jgi:ribosomal small subunit protein bTHX